MRESWIGLDWNGAQDDLERLAGSRRGATATGMVAVVIWCGMACRAVP